MPMVSAAVAIYFTSNQGLASGIGFPGATGGQLFAMPTLGVLVTWIGWRGTYATIGVAIFIFAAAAMASWSTRSNPPGSTLNGSGNRSRMSPPPRATQSRSRYGTVTEYAAAAVFLMSERTSYITRTTLCVDGGCIKAV